MVEISVTLIRRCHGNIGIDELEKMSKIDLSNQSIENIDNLEVFSEIEELVLSRNLISKIENLSFLRNLAILDVSFNSIDSVSLKAAVSELPPNIKSINLSGNPCCEDDACLLLLQDRYPKLGIIIGEESGDKEGDGGSDDEEAHDDTDLDPEHAAAQDSPRTRSVPLNSEEILKSIVERKCKLQSQESLFDLEAAISELNSEQELVVSNLTARKRFLKVPFSQSSDVEDTPTTLHTPSRFQTKPNSVDHFVACQSKYTALLEETKENRKDSHHFMESLRARAHESRNKLFASVDEKTQDFIAKDS